jgi:hypothetical protein
MWASQFYIVWQTTTNVSKEYSTSIVIPKYFACLLSCTIIWPTHTSTCLIYNFTQAHLNGLMFIYYRHKPCGRRINIHSCQRTAHTHYCPETRRWSLLGIQQMRMRKISWWMTSCYYPSWKHSHSSLAHYTLLEMLHTFSLCVAGENSSLIQIALQ